MTCGLGACGSDSTDAPQSPIDLRPPTMADVAEAPAAAPPEAEAPPNDLD